MKGYLKNVILRSGFQIRIANSLYCEKKRRRSEFASLRFAENLRGFAFASLRFLDVQIRRIAKKFAESSQKIVLLFFLKDSNYKSFFRHNVGKKVIKEQIFPWKTFSNGKTKTCVNQSSKLLARFSDTC